MLRQHARRGARQQATAPPRSPPHLFQQHFEGVFRVVSYALLPPLPTKAFLAGLLAVARPTLTVPSATATTTAPAS